MSFEANERLRRELLERLRTIGMSPDLVNDEAAVQAICRETGISTADVVRELACMRLETGRAAFQRMGIKQTPPAFLASVSSTRYSLLQQQKSARASFHEAYAERAKMTRHELIEDLGDSIGQSIEAQRSPSSLARYERDVEQDDMRSAP